MNESIKELIKNALVWLNNEIKDLKAEEDGSNTFKVIASSEDVDRAWETIKVDSWDDTNYKKNPVILANHSYKIENIVWKMTKIYKEWKNLIVEGIFSNNEMGKMTRELYNSWFLKAVSVWFMVKQRNEQDRDIVEKAELLELSFVAVPCNPNAVSLDGKLLKKGLELWLIKEEKEQKQKDNLEKRIESLEKQIQKHQKIFDNLANGKALLKNEDSNSNVDDIVKQFIQWLSKTSSNTLHLLKKVKN